MVWGGIIAGAAGALGGFIKNEGEQRRLDAIMEKAKKYKDGAPRAYGAQQDDLIAALSKGGTEQSLAEANVARTELGRGLAGAASSGDALGARRAMMTGEEANLAGGVGRAAGGESVGNLSGASTNITQASNDILNREKLRLEALRQYNEAKQARKSGMSAAIGGAANGVMAYYGAK